MKLAAEVVDKMVPSESITPRVDTRPFPDVILRSQFFELMGTRSLSSEQRLMLAVLADAINIVQDFHHSASARKRGPFGEAWSWIFAHGAKCPLAFESVCDALGIDAEALRWRLRALVSGEGKDTRAAPMRLRLKEASRVQRLTVNRVRRRRKARVHPLRDSR
ncbi:MAG: hypothetical protein ACYDC3_06140 [Candidatus Binataceae bacterium]